MVKMKDSGIEWIGEIPASWEVIKGKYLFTQRSSKGNKLSLTLLSPTQKYGVIPQSMYEELTGMKPVKIDQQKDLNLFKTIHKGDFCISLRSFEGGFEYSNYEGVVSPAYQVFYLIDNNSIDTYYKYLFKDKTFIDKMNSYTMSLRDGKNISFNDFGNTYITVPPKSEQQQIADYLDHKTAEIDGLIDKINTEIDTLKQYQSSVITQAVTKGLDLNVPMKDSGIEWIGEIPETWKVPKLKHLLLEPMKYGATESGVSYSDKLPRYIRITDITLDGNLKDIGKLSLTEQQAKNYILDDKDILFARSGATVGKTFFYRSFMGKSAFAGYLISAKIDEKKLDPKWVYYFTQTTSYMTWINNVFSQSTIQNISAEKYSNLPISMTYDIKEQRRIVDYLDNKVFQIKKIIKSKQQQITELTEYKNSLIFEYVTGKKQVKEAN